MVITVNSALEKSYWQQTMLDKLNLLKRVVSNCYELILPIIFLIGYQWYSTYLANERLSIIEHPQIHDFYLLDYHHLDPDSDAKYRYVPIKIINVANENITFKLGNIAHSQKNSVRDHVKFDSAMHKQYFRVGELVLSRAHIRDLVAQGVIYDAARPENIFIDGWIVMHMHELLG